MSNDIPLELIEKTLALTGKTIEDMTEIMPDGGGYEYEDSFSIEKFCYYLSSVPFLREYSKIHELSYLELSHEFGQAIYEHQAGNSNVLIKMLEKI